jgi:hypothetical protein
MLWFAFGLHDRGNMQPSDSWKIASAFTRLHELRKEIRISATTIKQSSAKQ